MALCTWPRFDGRKGLGFDTELVEVAAMAIGGIVSCLVALIGGVGRSEEDGSNKPSNQPTEIPRSKTGSAAIMDTLSLRSWKIELPLTLSLE